MDAAKKYTPIQPFNIMIGEDFSMYENPTYHRDLTLFDQDEVKMERGNVISQFRCNFEKPRMIGGDAPAQPDADSNTEDFDLPSLASETE